MTRYQLARDPSVQMLSPPAFAPGEMRDCSLGGCTKLAEHNWGMPLVDSNEATPLVIDKLDLLPVGLAQFAGIPSNFTGTVAGILERKFLVHLNGARHCTACVMYGAQDAQPPKCSKPTYERSACSVFKKDCFNYFPNLYESIIKMFTLITTANYPDVMMPAYDCHWIYGLVFVVWDKIKVNSSNVNSFRLSYNTSFIREKG